MERKRGKVRNQIRHETDPKVLAENKEQRAAITAEITALRNRVKRVKRIRKDASRLLNLLRTELQREYERMHPVKEQQKQRTQKRAGTVIPFRLMIIMIWYIYSGVKKLSML